MCRIWSRYGPLLMSDEATPVNLGNPHEMTILEFAQQVLAAVRGPSQVVFVHPDDERTQDDPMQRQPDISKARRLLGWEPQVSLEEGWRRRLSTSERVWRPDRPYRLSFFLRP